MAGITRTTTATRALARSYATLNHAPPAGKPPTAIVMLNMGGPSTVPETHDFLKNLFMDGDLIPLPAQKYLAPWIAKRRTPQIEAQYAAIGGGSPILRWSRAQGAGMAALLDELAPASAPHKAYVAFRYARPLTDAAAAEMRADGVTRAVAFTQYPQYSCSTTGSSLNELFRQGRAGAVGEGVEWSVIDRWGTHPGFVDAVALNIQASLAKFPEDKRSSAVLLFSAHSLPMSVVNRGDPYVLEVSATVSAVMDLLASKYGIVNPYRLVWQSQVGPSAWMGMQTGEAIKGLARLGKKDVVMVPIAFTSDHIETLFEMDLEYVKEGEKLGMHVERAASLNDSPVFIRALADIAAKHLSEYSAGRIPPASVQMGLRCEATLDDKFSVQDLTLILDICPNLYDLLLRIYHPHEFSADDLALLRNSQQSRQGSSQIQLRALTLNRCASPLSPVLYQLLEVWPSIRHLRIGCEIAAPPPRTFPHSIDLYELAMHRVSGPHLLSWLLSPPHAPALRILEMRDFPGAKLKTVLERHVRGLRSLRIWQHSFGSHWLIPRCVSLEELVMYLVPQVFPLEHASLPHTITHVYFRNPEWAFSETLRPVIDAVGALPRLRIVTCDANSAKTVDFDELVEACQMRDIQLNMDAPPPWVFEDPIPVNHFPRRRSVSNFAAMR